VSLLSVRAVAATCGLLLSITASAQGFSALVTPPRFEDAVKPGTTYRNVIEITNVSDRPARYRLQTADWTLDENASAVFSAELAPGSCRPWVGIEAPEITVAPKARRRYRFEVVVPADAPSGECRFAIMIEGEPSTVSGPLAVPVSGRIGVIVYVGVGDAAPRLDVVASRAHEVDGRVVPVLRVRNGGNAHGRLDGLVDGRDAGGRRYAFAPSNQPILPGETRDIVLTPQSDSTDAAAPTLAFPVTIRGELDTGAQRLAVDSTITR
jgi:fimbrial chaperone protein